MRLGRRALELGWKGEAGNEAWNVNGREELKGSDWALDWGGERSYIEVEDKERAAQNEAGRDIE